MIPMRPPITVHPAGTQDIPGIIALVNEHARRGNLLPRTPQAIRSGLADWIVASRPIPAGDRETVGCVSLLRYTSGLVEVRSLAVADTVQGQGVGQQLVQTLIAEAQRRHVPTLFALTRAVRFFERCGFSVSDRSLFPEKVWHDCRLCPIQHNCDETAVVLNLSPFAHSNGSTPKGDSHV